MRYYKSKSGEVYAYDETQTPLKGLVKMSAAEIEAHLAPKPIERTADVIKAEILVLEQRAIRPLLAGESDRVAEIRAQIKTLREELNAL